jgi:chemotaxis signal transduction protein
VVEVEAAQFESAPDTIPADLRRYIKGIYKMNGALLSVIDLDTLAKELSPATEAAS